MKILLWHGYLLGGSGSNVYTANIARAWREQGHDVLLMCQEHEPPPDLVDEMGVLLPSSRSITTRSLDTSPAPGRCRLVRPDIGTVLPVYVYDRYEHFDAKLFVDLDDDELEAYTEANVRALVTALRGFDPDAFVTGHEVMGPYIALEACRATGHSYVAKLHGSALEYAVKKQERYRGFAREGLCGAAAVVGGSRYMVAEAASIVPGWDQRAVVVNPGCDVDLFAPSPRSGPPTIGFVGKLIAQKGVQRLLAACGSLEMRPLALTIVGYGGDEAALRSMAEALQAGDLGSAAAAAASLGDLAVGEALARSDPDAWAGIDIRFTGRLEHGPLSGVLPGFDVLVVPSILPEAFGMVAAEAAAAGVLPVVPGHSGIGELGAAVEEAIGRPGWLTYDPADPVGSLAAALDRVLSLPRAERRRLEDEAVGLAHSRWSWTHVADALLKLAPAR